MKKIVFFILSLSLLLTLCACGGNTSSVSAPATAQTEAPAPTVAENTDAAPAEAPVEAEASADQSADPLAAAQLAMEAEDYDTAFDLLSQAADTGSVEAKYRLGLLFMEAYADVDQAEPLLEEAAAEGVTAALVELGRIAQSAGDYDRAAGLYTQAADAGEVAACYRLGSMYNSPLLEAPHDYALAEAWFLRGAETGDPDCCYGLGRLYAYGGSGQEGYGRDGQKAVQYLQQAGDRHAAALETLGDIYQKGILGDETYVDASGSLAFVRVVEPDLVKALDCFERAYLLDSGNDYLLSRIVSIGTAFLNGEGEEPDSAMAREAFAFAAEQGSAEARDLLDGLG
ncbi:MAG: sel1 repeat family protein [Oscillospiraceae bacterium]|nr:sel1 repeat family protein [Oscillospiraceae bacterium]